MKLSQKIAIILQMTKWHVEAGNHSYRTNLSMSTAEWGLVSWRLIEHGLFDTIDWFLYYQ